MVSQQLIALPVVTSLDAFGVILEKIEHRHWRIQHIALCVMVDQQDPNGESFFVCWQMVISGTVTYTIKPLGRGTTERSSEDYSYF